MGDGGGGSLPTDRLREASASGEPGRKRSRWTDREVGGFLIFFLILFLQRGGLLYIQIVMMYMGWDTEILALYCK